MLLSYIGDSKGLLSPVMKLKNRYNELITPAQTLKIPQDLGFSEEEWDRIQRAIHWGGPDHQITNLNRSTSPKHSIFIINNFKDSYYVGEELYATIIAKDFTGSPKTYGGDFFQAKVYSQKLKVMSLFPANEVQQNLCCFH